MPHARAFSRALFNLGQLTVNGIAILYKLISSILGIVACGHPKYGREAICRVPFIAIIFAITHHAPLDGDCDAGTSSRAITGWFSVHCSQPIWSASISTERRELFDDMSTLCRV